MSDESFIDKVKDFIKGHPDQADQGMDKGEEMLNERTGGQYSEQIAKGDDVVRQQLGLPDDSTTPTPEEPMPTPGEPTPTPGTTPEPSPVPDPSEPATTPGTTPPQTAPDPTPDTSETQP